MVSQPPNPLSDKVLREQKLAQALRLNLRRRKAAPRETPPAEDKA